VDFIVRTVMAQPGEVHLLAIGPLTNVALAFLREPRLSQNLAGLTLMAAWWAALARYTCPGWSTISAAIPRRRTSSFGRRAIHLRPAGRDHSGADPR